ncbi:ferredoxin-NADPH reductase [Xylanimonas protaetiae]|uniref:Ferredoxin-NADPH reductase n=1 Tax=Xylanimonas protaetiae TaxID=2509457 RepID=A0A4P6FA53_9MICO|nr:ferredoxin-NADPH reductase [Xylanimonas protaetiae]QAY70267.1 ferredoxin-NADPH reductase [Xylanimonas protaetiae]
MTAPAVGMPAPAVAPRLRVGGQVYTTVFGTLLTGLVVNAMLLVACLPIVVMLLTTDPARSWPALAVLAPLAAPAAVAAAAVFRQVSDDGAPTPVRTFGAAYRRHARRALAIGALLAAVAVVGVADLRFLAGRPAGALVTPVVGVVLLLSALTGVVALAAVPEVPAARLRDLLKAALFLAVRRWYLAGAALVVLALLAGIVAVRPAQGIGLLPAPLLYVAWGAARFALRLAIPETRPAGSLEEN